MKKILDRFSIVEPYFFYVLVFLFTIPVFSNKFFLTVDGPAHLYNSNLIIELFQNGDNLLNKFFNFNNTITPNWSGHFLMSLIIYFFPSFIAEKVVILFYIIGLPLSIRYLFNKLKINNRYLIYLIFPFIYSYLFYYGFYNFNIGQVLFFFGIGLWIELRKNRSLSSFLKLFFISSLICLSHLFVFGLFVMVISILNISEVILFIKSSKEVRIKLIKNFLFKLSSGKTGQSDHLKPE